MNISDDMIKGLCSDMVYKRGCECFSEGRVHIKKRSETEVAAVVDGEEVYNVFVKFDGGKIKSELCTCQYYETLQSPCKHIVAVLKQRQAELVQGLSVPNENDRIAEALCCEFSSHGERTKTRASFELFIRQNKDGEPEFEMSLSLPELGGRIQGLENFLDCYLNYCDFKIDRKNTYSRRKMYFPENEDNVIKIMAEVYQTRSSGVDLYRKASSKTSFGSAVVHRMLPYLANLDFKLIFDGIAINGARIKKEDPDILIDVEAYGRDIVMSLSESGFAITPNGEWFFYNDVIYNTSPVWRDYFMPIYRALMQGNRTQITFKNDNAMLFAAHVLPKLKNRHGVVINGVDEIVVNSEPEFLVVLDCDSDEITAVPSVSYGTMRFRLPSHRTEDEGKIVIRNYGRESEMLSYLSKFTFDGGAYRLSGDSNIYDFVTQTIKELAEISKIVMTERFKSVRIYRDFDLRVNASYKKNEDYLEIGFDSELSSKEINDLISALRRRERFYRTNSGSFIDLRENDKIDLLELLDTIGVSESDLMNGVKRLRKTELLRIDSAKHVDKDDSIREYINEVRAIEPKIPDNLNGVLRNYQKDGVAWFNELSELGMGGILADDMGLGKTLQTIAYIHGIQPDKPTLIVAPGTLVYNWQREIERFTPDVRQLLVVGNRETRSELIKTASEYEFVITSYPLLRRDIAQYAELEFSYCIIDEAQFIKNYKTMNALSVKKIRAEHKFALTGTPIENSVMELWSIFDFIMPNYLKSSSEFRSRFEGVSDNEAVAASLRQIIRPFVLRRMKKEVLNELPEKIETTMLAELSREQKALYQAYATEAKREAEGLLRSGKTMTLLTYLLRLRQICDHPMLVSGDTGAKSGKLEMLTELIEMYKNNGHRVLVFSQFRTMLDIIEGELNRLGITYFSINGDVAIEERVKLCELFNGGIGDVMLVSLKAGGTGINLTGADTVIHFDPWWNPAVTDQATDRAYRIGQTRAVQVIKLASQGTIEEKILKLEKKKRELAEDIIRSNGNTLKSFTDEEIISLFDVWEE